MMYSHPPPLNKNVCARNRHATLTCCIFLVYNSCKDINLKHKLKIEEQKATTIITSFEKVQRKCSVFTSKKFVVSPFICIISVSTLFTASHYNA